MFSVMRRFGRAVHQTRTISRKITTLPKVSVKVKTLALTSALIGGVYLSSTPFFIQNDVLSTVGAGVRFLRSAKIGIVISIDYFFSMLGLAEGDPNYDVMMGRIHTRAADRLLEGCLLNGGTYIKIGQGLVSLSHILPKEYIAVLTQLQDKCLTREEGEVNELFVQDFGKTVEEIYASFETKPVAAASLAQVYRATTKSKEVVAVKVQYIDLQRRFISDVATIDFLLKVIGVIHPSFNFGWVLDDIKESLREELDFVNEAKNSERCAVDLKHLKYIYVPKVYWDLSSTRVLVTEFIEGVKVNDVDSIKEMGLSLRDIDTKLCNAFGEQIFKTGFVHADPHPGNVLIRKKNNTAEIVLLDHGLYQSLTACNRLALSYFWKALVMKDHKIMKRYANDLGVSDYAMLAEILTQRPLKSRNFNLVHKMSDTDIKYMADFAQKRFDLIMVTLREMPRSLLLVVRNLNTIRAITHDHGDPVDRYGLLARIASKTAFEMGSRGFLQKLASIPMRFIFEIKLISARIWLWSIRILAKVLYILGRMPDTSHYIAQMA